MNLARLTVIWNLTRWRIIIQEYCKILADNRPNSTKESGGKKMSRVAYRTFALIKPTVLAFLFIQIVLACWN